MSEPWPSLRGPYSVIVAEPPWMYQKNPGAKGGGWDAFLGTAENAYPTMSNEALAALPVADLAAKDAHLFMWVTNPGMFGGRFSKITPAEIAEAWGFRFVTLLTWVKTTKEDRPLEGGMGWYFRGCTEHVLYAVRGKAAIPTARRESNLLLAQRGRHSAKPEAFMPDGRARHRRPVPRAVRPAAAPRLGLLGQRGCAHRARPVHPASGRQRGMTSDESQRLRDAEPASSGSLTATAENASVEEPR